MEGNRNRGSGVARHKILSEEEWLRINEHLLTLEKLKKEKASIIDSRKLGNQVLVAGGPRRTLKSRELVKEQSKKKKEALTEMKPFGKHLMSEKNKEEILNRAKKILLENKDYARRLFHGLRLSSVLHERNKQMDFGQRVRNMMDVMDKEIKMKLREEAKDYEQDLIRNKIKRKENNAKLRKELDKQIYEKMEGRQRVELDKGVERKNLIKMNEELKKILEREREENERKKEKLKKDIENYIKSEREARAKLKMKEDEQEEVNKIYQTVAWQIDNWRRDKEKSRFRKTIKIEKETFTDVKEGLKIHSDGDKKLKNFLFAREARKKALLHDLLAGKKMAEEEVERRRNEEKSERLKCSVERCRKEEADRLRSLKEKQERRKRMDNMGKYYIMQWTERKESVQKEKELDRFYAPDFTEENKIIADYCDEFLGLVKLNRRPIFPVAAAVKDVKNEFGLETVKNIHFLKSNVPIGK